MDIKETAKKVMEISKLEYAIANQLVEKDRLATQLGYVVFNTYDNIDRDSIANLVVKMDSADKKIKEMKDKVYKLKGLKKCESCGEVSKADQNFCGKCGAKLPECVEDEADDIEVEVPNDVEEIEIKINVEPVAEDSCGCDCEKKEEACAVGENDDKCECKCEDKEAKDEPEAPVE